MEDLKTEYDNLKSKLISVKDLKNIELKLRNKAKTEGLTLTGFFEDYFDLSKDLIEQNLKSECFHYSISKSIWEEFKDDVESLLEYKQWFYDADDELLFINENTPGFIKFRFWIKHL